MLLGRNAAGPRPEIARAKSRRSAVLAVPAMMLQITSQPMPMMKRSLPPYISENRPMGRRKQEITREKAEAGQVCAERGMSSAETTDGTSTLKPETKYSYDGQSLHFDKD